MEEIKIEEILRLLPFEPSEEEKNKILREEEEWEKVRDLTIEMVVIGRQIKELQERYAKLQKEVLPEWERLATEKKPKTSSTFYFSREGVRGEVTYRTGVLRVPSEKMMEAVKLVLEKMPQKAPEYLKVDTKGLKAALDAGVIKQETFEGLVEKGPPSILFKPSATEEAIVAWKQRKQQREKEEKKIEIEQDIEIPF